MVATVLPQRFLSGSINLDSLSTIKHSLTVTLNYCDLEKNGRRFSMPSHMVFLYVQVCQSVLGVFLLAVARQ